MRAPIIWSLSLLALSSCGGDSGGGGGGEPPPEPNEPPALTAAPELGGGPVQFQLVLPVAAAQTLNFSATDPNGDPLSWQVSVGGASQAAAGLSFTSPAFGATFTLELEPVAAPAAATVNLLVEDPNGGAAAIDVQFVRSGAPTITGVSPDSAFVSAPQQATVTGTSLLLGGAVNTVATFGSLAAGNAVVVDDTTLTCTTPSPGLLGPNSVAVQNAFGTDSLPVGAFTMYGYPVDLFAADAPIDAGAGSSLQAVGEGRTLHAVWIEGGALVHRRSLDGGATWSAPQTLSGGEVPSDPQLSARGDEVLVAWIGDGAQVLARSSADGGSTFDAAVTVEPAVGGGPSTRLRLARAGARVYAAWLQGQAGLNQRRVHAAATPNNGGVWQATAVVSDQGANHDAHAIGCDENAAWIAFSSGAGGAVDAGVYTSRSSDGGFLWTAGALRSAVSTGIGEVAVCDDGGRVSLAWTRDGQLEYLVSQNSGLGWQTQPTLFRGADLGPISEVTVRADGDRLAAVYVAGGQNVAFSRVGAAGALPEHVTLSDAVEPAAAPTLELRGSYVFSAWRGGDLGGGVGSARIKLATSTDLGVGFTAPATFGDGTAAQDLPRMLVDGARVWLGWLDYRGATPALFTNRTEG